jgi:hypothetical protein
MAALLVAFGPEAVGDNTGVEYPSGYRTWQHVKSMIIQPGHPLEDQMQIKLKSATPSTEQQTAEETLN